MISRTTRRFRTAFSNLPAPIQIRAREAYRLFAANPNHPSLQFKKVHGTRPIYSARVGLAYRALAVRRDDALIWFWIGSHSEYDRLLRTL